MGVKDEIYAMGIAKGFISALAKEEIANRGRFEELVSIISEAVEVSGDVAKGFVEHCWKSSSR